MEVIQVRESKKRFLSLLLLGDEQESMIDRYLENGEMFVLFSSNNQAIAEAVVADNSDGIFEIKNFAVDPAFQRHGYGRYLINYLFTHYQGRAKKLIVGTGETAATMNFYLACGFCYSHRIENFFTDHYDHQIIEEGHVLKDMVYFSRPL